MTKFFCFGLGYTAKVFARAVADLGWEVTGTSRTETGCAEIVRLGFKAIHYDGFVKRDEIAFALDQASHLLVSVAPQDVGDPVLNGYCQTLENAGHLAWAGYLSTVGVYGDHEGRWIDEETPPKPVSVRSRRRILAEQAWLDLWKRSGLPIHIFRLSGIYGPGRSPVENLKAGRARRIVKDGQVFNRIHVDDIARVLLASIERPNPGSIYNVTDNEPAPPQDVVTFAAETLGVEPPPFVAFDEADLSEMGRSFYGENKRVSNQKIRDELGVSLSYPTYREGVTHLARLSLEASS